MEKKKQRNAFTLIEIVSVIVIIGMFLLITFPTISRAVLMSQFKYYEGQEMSFLAAGRNYFSSDRMRLPKNVGEKSTISLSTLIEEGYIEPIVDTENRECDLNDSYVQATNIDKGEYHYYVRLICIDYDTVVALGEWSNWSTEVPTGENIEIESATFYNYQTLTSYNSNWSDWTDVVAESGSEIEPVSRIVGAETQYRTVYSFVDQQWRWFATGTESQCASTSPGTDWTQGAGCSTTTQTQCASTSPGTGWTQGNACGTTTQTQCASTSPGTGWTLGNACGTTTQTQCASTSPGTGWTQGAGCSTATQTQCASTSPGTGWTQGNACGTTTQTQCASTSPGTGWTQGAGCSTATQTQCASSIPTGTGWSQGSSCAWTTGTETAPCSRSAPSGTGWVTGAACTVDSYTRDSTYHYGFCPDGAWYYYSCSGNCNRECPDGYVITGTSVPNRYCGTGSCIPGVDVKTCYETWSGASCTLSGNTYSRTTTTASSWDYTRTITDKWDYTRTVASSWDYTRTSTDKWDYTRTVASSWDYTRTVANSWDYTRTVTDRWDYTRPTITYATGFHSTSPSGFPTRDDAQTQFTTPTAWSDILPTSHSFRTISNKQQTRTRNLITDWSGNLLVQPVTEAQIITILNKSMQEIQADPNIRLIPVVMYRFRISKA